MKKMVLISWVFFSLTIIAILTFNVMTLVKQEQETARIDLAGRQRMLNQQHLAEILEVSQGSNAPYLVTRKHLNQTLDVLTAGGQATENLMTGERITLPPIANELLAENFQTQKRLIKEFSSKADQFLLFGNIHPSYAIKLNELIVLNRSLHDLMDEVVKSIRHRSETRIARIIRWEVAVGFFVVVFGFLLMYNLVRVNRKRDWEMQERIKNEKLLALQYKVAKLLAMSQNLQMTALNLLQCIGQDLHAAFASYWEVDPTADVLQCRQTWSSRGDTLTEFKEGTQRIAFAKGVGLPGRVWETGAPLSIFDVVVDANFPRASLAGKSGLHGGFGFPIQCGNEFLGVIEMFTTMPQELDDDLLQIFFLLGNQIGQFIRQRRAEEQIAISEARLTEILKCAHEGVIAVDENHVIQLFNQGAEKIFGYRIEEVLNQPLDLLLPGRFIEKYYAQIHTCSKGPEGTSSMEMETTRQGYGRRKDGREFPVEASISQTFMKGQTTFTIILRDISQRQAAENALRQAYENTEELLTSISLILIGVDKQGSIAQWNRAAEQTFGLLAPQVQGQTFRFCREIHWDWSMVNVGVRQCLETHQPIRLDELRYTKLSGEEGFLFLTLNPIKDEKEGKVPGLLILGGDISEQTELETQLILAQKMESVGQLAAGIAHEINTPTQFVSDNLHFLQDSFSAIQTVLMTYDHLLQSLGAGSSDPQLVNRTKSTLAKVDLDFMNEEIPKALNQSLDGAERIAKIVRAMKDFSHPGTAQKQLLDLNRTIESTSTVATNEWKYVANLVTDFDPTLPLVPCLPGEFNQVILNLLINAVHAISDSRTQSKESMGTITISTREKGEWVEVQITDTGTGIPEAARGKIFDPFFTTKTVGKGTGQGLTIAHDIIINKHGGTLTFETELGKGTTFVIRLPLKDMPVCQEAE
ncbi:MAG: PAS domain S-box protein [Nitrospirales bacterium]